MMIKVEKMVLRFERVHVSGRVLGFGDISLKWFTAYGGISKEKLKKGAGQAINRAKNKLINLKKKWHKELSYCNSLVVERCLVLVIGRLNGFL